MGLTISLHSCWIEVQSSGTLIEPILPLCLVTLSETVRPTMASRCHILSYQRPGEVQLDHHNTARTS